MEIIDLPFNHLIDLNKSDDPNYLLMIKADRKYTNHLNTVHAAALFSLAEGTSGHYLFVNFPHYQQSMIPVVRAVDVKYKRPASGAIYSTATVIHSTLEQIEDQLKTRSRSSIRIRVELFDLNKVGVMTAEFEWFVSKIIS